MLHEIFKEFVFKFNIRNGELASQQKLNESSLNGLLFLYTNIISA